MPSGHAEAIKGHGRRQGATTARNLQQWRRRCRGLWWGLWGWLGWTTMGSNSDGQGAARGAKELPV